MLQVVVGVMCCNIWAVSGFQDCIGHSFDISLARRLDVSDLPEHWNELTLDPVTQEIGDDWIESASSAFLMVPSVTIPEEMIYLMNPQHDDVEKAIAGEITPFIFDPRLS
jgi:RES domain-containing protein